MPSGHGKKRASLFAWLSLKGNPFEKEGKKGATGFRLRRNFIPLLALCAGVKASALPAGEGALRTEPGVCQRRSLYPESGPEHNVDPGSIDPSLLIWRCSPPKVINPH